MNFAGEIINTVKFIFQFYVVRLLCFPYNVPILTRTHTEMCFTFCWTWVMLCLDVTHPVAIAGIWSYNDKAGAMPFCSNTSCLKILSCSNKNFRIDKHWITNVLLWKFSILLYSFTKKASECIYLACHFCFLSFGEHIAPLALPVSWVPDLIKIGVMRVLSNFYIPLKKN